MGPPLLNCQEKRRRGEFSRLRLCVAPQHDPPQKDIARREAQEVWVIVVITRRKKGGNRKKKSDRGIRIEQHYFDLLQQRAKRGCLKQYIIVLNQTPNCSLILIDLNPRINFGPATHSQIVLPCCLTRQKETGGKCCEIFYGAKSCSRPFFILSNRKHKNEAVTKWASVSERGIYVIVSKKTKQKYQEKKQSAFTTVYIHLQRGWTNRRSWCLHPQKSLFCFDFGWRIVLLLLLLFKHSNIYVVQEEEENIVSWKAF